MLGPGVPWEMFVGDPAITPYPWQSSLVGHPPTHTQTVSCSQKLAWTVARSPSQGHLQSTYWVSRALCWLSIKTGSCPLGPSSLAVIRQIGRPMHRTGSPLERLEMGHSGGACSGKTYLLRKPCSTNKNGWKPRWENGAFKKQ